MSGGWWAVLDHDARGFAPWLGQAVASLLVVSGFHRLAQALLRRSGF